MMGPGSDGECRAPVGAESVGAEGECGGGTPRFVSLSLLPPTKGSEMLMGSKAALVKPGLDDEWLC